MTYLLVYNYEPCWSTFYKSEVRTELSCRVVIYRGGMLQYRLLFSHASISLFHLHKKDPLFLSHGSPVYHPHVYRILCVSCRPTPEMVSFSAIIAADFVLVRDYFVFSGAPQTVQKSAKKFCLTAEGAPVFLVLLMQITSTLKHIYHLCILLSHFQQRLCVPFFSISRDFFFVSSDGDLYSGRHIYQTSVLPLGYLLIETHQNRYLHQST